MAESPTPPKRMYLIYDGRAILGSTDEAMVLVASGNSLKQARRDARGFGECAIYSYEEAPGNKLVDERFEEIVNR